MRDWQTVFRDTLQYRAEIVKAVLEDHNMQPVLLNKKDSAYQLGFFEIKVAPEHVIQALKLINDDINFE
ncbi:putative signal transducing protein [Marinoscillum furvescens]|uniref:Uncharacterized protein n=1 Tax=Marinoscillum furvescens DSM 4134 TaxID=1122208 RepID=A0A3D9L361_MARFU|nr:DUF2007 domain-containing protein [Marinoscillum furvescens]RED99579.1 hypothetical protein C7460_108201 [Marinoscillum furvescens DSM 4134]